VRVGQQSRHIIGYMKDFLFRPEQAGTPLGDPSARVADVSPGRA
jgi:ABC transport system ATP-binding/permease protein